MSWLRSCSRTRRSTGCVAPTGPTAAISRAPLGYAPRSGAEGGPPGAWCRSPHLGTIPAVGMQAAGRPADEGERLRELRRLAILDRERDADLDAIARAAARALAVPMALASVLDEERQWIAGAYGTEVRSIPRTMSVCGHVVESGAPLAIGDLWGDARFADNPLVVGPPASRFYAGVPIRVGGHDVGVLCVVDPEPRALETTPTHLLPALAELAARWLVQRRRLEMLEKVVHTAPSMLAYVDAERRVRFVNAAHAEWVGRAPAEAAQEPHEPPQDPHLEAALRGEPRSFEGHVRAREDGAARPMRVTYVPHVADGVVHGVVVQRDDASGSESRFRSVLDAAPTALLVLDDAGEITLANRHAASAFATTEPGLVGRSIFTFLPSCPTPPRAFVEGPPLEQLALRADGTSFPAEVRFRHVEALDGRSLLASIEDTTERQRAAMARGHLAAIVESSTDAIIGFGTDERITSWNGAAQRLFGWTAQEAIGRDVVSLLVPSSLQAEADAAREEARAQHRMSSRDTVRLHKEGHEIPVSVALSLVRDGHQRVTGVAAIVRDASDRKRAEAQLLAADRLTSLGTLVAGVGHEINNPLTTVVSGLEIASAAYRTEGPRPPDLPEALADAQAAAERIRRIVSDLRRFSRVDDERNEPVEILPVLERTLRMAAHQTSPRARVVRRFEPDVPPVLGNEARLGQVFLNLVINAAQAIPEGRPSEHEIVVAARTDGSQLVVTVADTGVGIPPEIQPRIFSPFFTTKPVGEGTGLGLALAQGIIESAGGTIRFESAPGRGTEFEVRLPVALERPAPVMARMPTPAPRRRGRVLVIDDDDMVARTLDRTLRARHDITVEVESRRALERLLAGETFDVVICDLMMPEPTGMQIHAALRESRPSLAERMVLVTGGAFTPEARDFLDRVPNARIEKPFGARELRALVDELVGD
ncbi:MAG: PAS domain S-box protein [Sandaracinus sp.]